MRLEEIRIRSFRSIDDTGSFSIDPKITCLLGKNESGKTNILLALETLQKGKKYTPESICYRTPSVEDFLTEKNEILECRFLLEEADGAWLEEIHPKATQLKSLVIRKYSNGAIEVEPVGRDISMSTLDGRMEEIEGILDEIRGKANAFSGSLSNIASEHPPFVPEAEKAEERIKDFLDNLTADMDGPEIQSEFGELFGFLQTLPNKNPAIKSLFNEEITSLDELKNTLVLKLNEGGPTEDFLKHLPKLVYIKDIPELVDNVDVDAFVGNKDAQPSVRDFERLANIRIESLRAKKIDERSRATDEASARLNRIISKVWEQEKLTFALQAHDNTFAVLVKDDAGGHDHPSVRSDGFRWFLAFLIHFYRRANDSLSNTILLLDDPGLRLHPSGQKNLLELFEEISKDNQIIYSTHSPFLVDKNNLQRVRVVSKTKDTNGSVIVEKFHQSDDDSLAPIRAAIGATIGDSLFFSEKTVIVEGYSDYLILEGMNLYAESLDKDHMDSKSVSILPVGGATKTPYFASLLKKENCRYVVVLDNDDAGRNTFSKLRDMEYLDPDCTLKLDEVLSSSTVGDSTIEDLMDKNIYIKAVLKVYENILTKSALDRIRKLKAERDQIPQKCQSIINEHKTKSFDKVEVSKQIFETLNGVLGDETKVSKKSTQMFVNLFFRINKKLES